MNRSQDPLHFLADIITNRTSNESFENSRILTQPPEVTFGATPPSSTASATIMVKTQDMGASSNAADPPAGAAAKRITPKRKSKLKKSSRQSSISVLETVPPPGTVGTAADTTAAAAASASESATSNAAGGKNAAGAARSRRSPTRAAAGAAAAGRRKGSSSKAINSKRLLSQLAVGKRLAVYWLEDDTYYPGVVAARRPGRGHKYTIHYDDGEVEDEVDLATEKFRFADDATASPATSVDELRTTLEELRQRIGDPRSARRILAILRDDLAVRSDVTFRTLLRTGIGRTVSRLSKHEDAAVSEAAIPILERWREIDVRTPASEKAAIKASVDAAPVGGPGAGAGGRRRGAGAAADETPGMPAAAGAAPVTPASKAAIDLTDSPSPPPSETRGSRTRRKTTPSSEKPVPKAGVSSATTTITPASVRDGRDDDERGGGKSSPAPPSPPELTSSSSSKRTEAVVPATGKKRKGRADAPGADGAATAPAEPPPAPVERSSGDAESGGRRGPSAGAAASATAVAPASVRDERADEGRGEKKSRASPPESTPSSSLKENEAERKGRASASGADGAATTSAEPPPVPVGRSNGNAKPGAKSIKAKSGNAAVIADTNVAIPKPMSSSPLKETEAVVSSGKKKLNATTTSAKPPPAPVKQSNGGAKPGAKPGAKSGKAKSINAAAAAAAAGSKPPPKKKKRSFHDQILYTMLTACKPYTLKSLAKETGTTAEALRNAMLSLLDKKLVLCKEFPGKKGSTREPKKLYWANPMGLAELEDCGGGGKGKRDGGGGAVARELSKLLSGSEEIGEARGVRQRLEGRHRALQGELTPLLAIPTMKELDDQISAGERGLEEARGEIRAARDRTENASAPPAAPNSGGVRNRFGKRPPALPADPTSLKRRINHMLGEYKTRKRKCMDFVEELSDAMEKKTKDVVGDKVLELDTDEREWGCYEDGSTGKIFGTKPKANGGGPGGRGVLQRRKSNGPAGSIEAAATMNIVKIPAKYKDI